MATIILNTINPIVRLVDNTQHEFKTFELARKYCEDNGYTYTLEY